MNDQKYFKDEQRSRTRGTSGSPSPPLPRHTLESFKKESFQKNKKKIIQKKPRAFWPRKRAWSKSDTGSVTETRSKTHTFLLLSDDDFLSKQEDEDVDLYEDVPEESFVQ